MRRVWFWFVCVFFLLVLDQWVVTFCHSIDEYTVGKIEFSGDSFINVTVYFPLGKWRWRVHLFSKVMKIMQNKSQAKKLFAAFLLIMFKYCSMGAYGGWNSDFQKIWLHSREENPEDEILVWKVSPLGSFANLVKIFSPTPGSAPHMLFFCSFRDFIDWWDFQQQESVLIT